MVSSSYIATPYDIKGTAKTDHYSFVPLVGIGVILCTVHIIHWPLTEKESQQKTFESSMYERELEAH